MSAVAKAVLIPHGQSHPFTQRECVLSEPAKVGRSLAKTKIQADNFIFDCRVLSRNHALIWFQDKKFFIQDTKSSNGTFVNERRLSPTGEESRPMELKSGDVIQFGVNVEGPTKVTHGCIIAIIKLSVNGKEYVSSSSHSLSEIKVEPQESVNELVRILETAFLREQDMENKLVYMHDLLAEAQVVVKDNMSAVVKEDHLLARMRMLENQIQAYSQDVSEDDLKTKLAEAYKEREEFEVKSKQTLLTAIEEKVALRSRYEAKQQEYDKAEQECSHYKTLFESGRQEHLLEVSSLNEKLKSLEQQCKEVETQLSKEQQNSQEKLESLNREMNVARNSLSNKEEEVNSLKHTCERLQREVSQLRETDQLRMDGDNLTEATTQTDDKSSYSDYKDTVDEWDVEEEYIKQAANCLSAESMMKAYRQVAEDEIAAKQEVIDTLQATIDEYERQFKDLTYGGMAVPPRDDHITGESLMSVSMPGGLSDMTAGDDVTVDAQQQQPTEQQIDQKNANTLPAVSSGATAAVEQPSGGRELSFTSMALLLSIGVVIGAVIAGYLF